MKEPARGFQRVVAPGTSRLESCRVSAYTPRLANRFPRKQGRPPRSAAPGARSLSEADPVPTIQRGDACPNLRVAPAAAAPAAWPGPTESILVSTDDGTRGGVIVDRQHHYTIADADRSLTVHHGSVVQAEGACRSIVGGDAQAGWTRSGRRTWCDVQREWPIVLVLQADLDAHEVAEALGRRDFAQTLHLRRQTEAGPARPRAAMRPSTSECPGRGRGTSRCRHNGRKRKRANADDDQYQRDGCDCHCRWEFEPFHNFGSSFPDSIKGTRQSRMAQVCPNGQHNVDQSSPLYGSV